jgi:hypothetical protein
MNEPRPQYVPPIAQLMQWEGGGGPPEQTYLRLQAHPAFGQAARRLAGRMLDVAAADPLLDRIFKDAGHYVVALWSLYLNERAA